MSDSHDTLSRSPRLRAPKLADRLVIEFSNRIRDGLLGAGTKLPTEFEIMRQHNVSRAVVREAISRLQAAGMVESRQGIGTFVLDTISDASVRIDPATVVTMRDVLALLELRISFETESAALAATRRTTAELERIGSCVQQIQDLLDRGADQTTKADFEFHLAVASATQNRYFIEVLSFLGLAILPRTRVDLRYMAKNSASEYLNRSNQEHRAIYQAIERKDSTAARAAMLTHLSNSRERLQKLSESTPKALDGV